MKVRAADDLWRAEAIRVGMFESDRAQAELLPEAESLTWLVAVASSPGFGDRAVMREALERVAPEKVIVSGAGWWETVAHDAALEAGVPVVGLSAASVDDIVSLADALLVFRDGVEDPEDITAIVTAAELAGLPVTVYLQEGGVTES